MKQKAALPQTRFGDAYNPQHLESINKLSAVNLA
jgi:hypothetical protein